MYTSVARGPTVEGSRRVLEPGQSHARAAAVSRPDITMGGARNRPARLAEKRRVYNKAHKSDPYYKLFMKKPKKFWRFHAKSKAKDYYSEEFMDLLTKMFSYDPKNRLTLDEIMASDYMKGEVY